MKGISSATVAIIIATISVSLVGSYFISRQLMREPTEMEQLGIGILQVSTITGVNCNEVQANCADAGKACRGGGQCSDSGSCSAPGCPDLPNAYMTSNDCSATYNTGCKYCVRPVCGLDPTADSCIESGSCNYECDNGWFDEDGDPNNGCETTFYTYTLELPGETLVSSSDTAPGNPTTYIEFNPLSSIENDVEPCVNDWSCAVGHIQDASSNIPIFRFTNTGVIAEQWEISLSTDLPSEIELYGDTDPSGSSKVQIPTSGWIFYDNILPTQSVDLYLWADFTDATPGSVLVSINHASMSAA